MRERLKILDGLNREQWDGRIVVSKVVAARIMGCSRNKFTDYYVTPGFVEGFIRPGTVREVFFVEDLLNIRGKVREKKPHIDVNEKKRTYCPDYLAIKEQVLREMEAAVCE